MLSKRMVLLLAALIALALVLGACGASEEEAAPEGGAAEGGEAKDMVKVAYIYIGQPGDLGWTFEHDQGRIAMEESLGDKVEVITVPDVPEGPEAEKAIRDVVQQGADVVFATSFGYMDPMLAVAGENPDVKFEHCSGFKTADNMATYFGRMYQPRYLSGLVAGAMTETNLIGYVAAFPIPEVIRGINGFTLGVREANPDAEVRVVWSNTWYDPVKEREAAEALLDEGADIITQHQDTTEPQKAAKERGLLSVGYDSDMGEFVGESVLTSPVWNWGPYYTAMVEDVLDGSWETHEFWGGLADGVVELAPYSPKVPDDVQATTEAAKEKILSGDWDVFCGPIMGQDGSEKVAEGECMDDGSMLGMDWFVEGVAGTIPEQ